MCCRTPAAGRDHKRLWELPAGNGLNNIKLTSSYQIWVRSQTRPASSDIDHSRFGRFQLPNPVATPLPDSSWVTAVSLERKRGHISCEKSTTAPSGTRVQGVVDTNVLVSGLLWRGPPHTLMELTRADAFTLVSSPALLAEFERVVRRRKFYAILERSQTDARRMVREVTRLSEIVEAPALSAPVSRDSDDDHVLAVASAEAIRLVRV